MTKEDVIFAVIAEHQRNNHYNILVDAGSVEFQDECSAKVHVEYDWRLNAWEKHVSKDNYAIQGADGIIRVV